MGLTDGLLERDGDLADLEALLGEARDGSGAVALIHGEAGIGKTSLVRAFVERHVDEAFVLTGGCDDLRTPRPLGPVWDMAYDDPSLFDALGHDDRHQVFHRVLELCSRSLRPTIVVIEDVHWADEASLDLVTFLGRRIERTHALLVLTFRDEPANADALAGLLADLPHDRRIHVPVRPLTLEAVRALAGDELDPRSIWEVSGGNPFLATELAAVGNSGVPASVLDVAPRPGQRTLGRRP